MNEKKLKHAVELGDGWSWVDDLETEPPCVLPANCSVLWPIDELPQFILDALAAQLVRQVDAMDGPVILMINPGVTEIVEPDGHIAKDGPDRTENTINACVEFLSNPGEKTPPRS